MSFADVTQAFCQADALVRAAGDLWVETCDGIKLPKGSLIRLVAPIYGLHDSPLKWHLTVVKSLEDLGFARSLFEPCWFVKRESGGNKGLHEGSRRTP